MTVDHRLYLILCPKVTLELHFGGRVKTMTAMSSIETGSSCIGQVATAL